MDYQIYFPNLGIYLEYVIKSISIGSFTIWIYGITMATGLLFGLWFTLRRARETHQNPESYLTLFILLLIFGFTGARLYYVAFTWDYYQDHLLEIFNLRGGGIGIYGGLIAGIIVIIVFCRVKKMNFFTIVDTVAMGVIGGQIIGRWGNFFNREAFGQYTDGLLAMQLPVSAVRESEITQEMWEHVQTINGVDFIQVTPTFLYEGLWNLGVLILLCLFRNKVKFKGEMFFRYLFGYGLGRFWIESLRTDQLQIGSTGIPISMVVAASAVGVSVAAILYGRRHANLAAKKFPVLVTLDERGMAVFGDAKGMKVSSEGEESKEKPADGADGKEGKQEDEENEAIKMEEENTETEHIKPEGTKTEEIPQEDT